MNGSVNPEGAAVNVSFQFGTTTAYGSQTAAQKIGVSNSSQTFSASLAGLPSGTTIHYRAVQGNGERHVGVHQGLLPR